MNWIEVAWYAIAYAAAVVLCAGVALRIEDHRSTRKPTPPALPRAIARRR